MRCGAAFQQKASRNHQCATAHTHLGSAQISRAPHFMLWRMRPSFMKIISNTRNAKRMLGHIFCCYLRFERLLSPLKFPIFGKSTICAIFQARIVLKKGAALKPKDETEFPPFCHCGCHDGSGIPDVAARCAQGPEPRAEYPSACHAEAPRNAHS